MRLLVSACCVVLLTGCAAQHETVWVGAVAVGNERSFGVGWLPDRELGLRSDGVLVWRHKSGVK